MFLDESGYLLTPTVRRTLAPRSQTPIVRSWDRRDRISAISAMTVSPKRRKLNLYFQLLPDNRNAHAADTVAFLRHLRRHLPGNFTVIWDRSTIRDRSCAVRAFLAKHPEIVTEKFPRDAPELSPDELVWSHTKHGRLANSAPANSKALRRKVRDELSRLRTKPELLKNFIRHVGLPLRL